MINHGFILHNVANYLNYDLKPRNLSEALVLKPAAEWVLDFECECQTAVRALRGIRYELPEAQLIRHIQLNYIDVILLIEQLRNYEQSCSVTEVHAPTGFYLRLIPILEIVLRHLKSMSEHYVEPNQRIPDHQFRLYLEELRRENLVLKSKFKGKKIDAELQALIMNYFENFLLLKTSTYQQQHYTKDLLTGLIKSMSISADGDLTNLLISTLIALNFNSPLYYSFCKRRLAVSMSRETDLKTQISTLQYFSKELQTCIPIAKAALDPNAETIKQSLQHLLDAEIRYRESQISAERQEPGQQPTQAATIVEGEVFVSGEKLKINSTMHQLTLFIGLMVHMKYLILGKSGMKGLLGVFAKHVSTIGTENLSVNSMQKRVAERNSPACLSLLTVLEQMIVILKQDFMS